MTASPLRVYISASWKGDLEDERKAIEELIKSDLLMSPIFPKEASIRDVISNYFKKMDECDFVVVILGALYSKHVYNEINYAFSIKIPVLCFIKDCEKDKELENEISELEDNRITTILFKTIEDLKKEVKKAVVNLLSEKFKDYIEIEKSILRLINKRKIEVKKPKPLRSEYIEVPRIDPFEKI